MARNVLAVIQTDHRRIGRLIDRLFAGRTSFPVARDELVQLARAHLVAERGVVHPAAAERAAHAEDLEAADEAAQRLDALLAEVATLSDRPADDTRRATLAEALAAHVQAEERVSHVLHDACAQELLRRWGGDYGRERDAVAHRFHVAPAIPRRFDRPRTELYEMARKAGIEGRTRMSRDELIAALRAHEEQHNGHHPAPTSHHVVRPLGA